MSIYRFLPTRQPSPGAMAAAFARPSSLPVYEWDGPGIRVFWSFRPLQYPQIFQYKEVPTSGYGGTVSGGILHQPLQDTEGF